MSVEYYPSVLAKEETLGNLLTEIVDGITVGEIELPVKIDQTAPHNEIVIKDQLVDLDVNVVSVSGNLAQETGGNLDAINTNTSNIDGKLGSLGQKLMAGSAPVVIASDQSNINVNVASITGNIAQETGGNLDSIDASNTAILAESIDINSKLNTLGQKTSAASAPVVLASDQSTLDINIANISAGIAEEIPTNLERLNGNLIDLNSGNASSGTQRVVIASDQSNVNINIQSVGGVDITASPVPTGPVVNYNIGNSDTLTQRIVSSNDDPNLSAKIPNACILNRDSNILDYYFKGWSTSLPVNFKTLGTPSVFDEISLPSANTSLQISSDTASDVSISILVSGYDSSFASVSEIVVTDGASGQNLVNLANQYFRINSMRIVSESNNTGTIYLSIQGASVTGGVPDSQANYIYSMLPSDRVGWILNACVPPSADGFLYPMNVAYSIANDTGQRSEIHFQMKKTNSNFWYTEFNFYIDERSNSQYQWDLRGIGGILNNDTGTPTGYDLRIQAQRISAGACNVSSSMSVKQK